MKAELERRITALEREAENKTAQHTKIDLTNLPEPERDDLEAVLRENGYPLRADLLKTSTLEALMRLIDENEGRS